MKKPFKQKPYQPGSKRQAMDRGKAEKLFTETAKLTHKKNLQGAPMRGGIRL